MENIKIEASDFQKFLGTWHTVGRILNKNPNDEVHIKGIDTYELILDGHFILHKADVLMGKTQSLTHEIIGFDHAKNHFTTQHFDNSGNSGHMQAMVKNGLWTYQGESLRFTGKFSDQDRVFGGVWTQLKADQTWQDFIEIRLTKST